MTHSAFNLFQRATCEIAEGDKQSAARTLAKAIAWIDRTGRDREMRADLLTLKEALA